MEKQTEKTEKTSVFMVTYTRICLDTGRKTSQKAYSNSHKEAETEVKKREAWGNRNNFKIFKMLEYSKYVKASGNSYIETPNGIVCPRKGQVFDFRKVEGSVWLCGKPYDTVRNGRSNGINVSGLKIKITSVSDGSADFFGTIGALIVQTVSTQDCKISEKLLNYSKDKYRS